MATTALTLHRGARVVTADELREIKAPPSEGRWHPVAHARVLDTVSATLVEAGYRIEKSKFGVTPDGHRFFGTLDLATPIATGVTLAVGVRNSTDKSFPLGFCAGNRVFVCDNLAFRAELLVRKKHTLNGERNFVRAIGGAVVSLKSFQETEADRIKRFVTLELTDDQADALILRAYERGILGARELPKVIREWRTPSFDDFKPRTAWSLLNAFTSALRDRSTSRPHEFAVQTIRLNGLIDTKAPDVPALSA
jgi:hypothetical protein